MKCGIGLARPLAKASRLLVLWLVFFSACTTGTRDPEPFDWQGHRGARGEAPENTLEGMLRALQEGVKTLEMDVVLSKDSVVLLSHEPWFNPDICLDFSGNEWAGDSLDPNLFHYTYEEISKVDCGSKEYDRFPGQEHYFAVKPRLIDVILEIEETAIIMNRPEPYYNIEIKSRPEWDEVYYPNINLYCDLVLSVLEKANLGERLIVQSFDPRVLRYLNEEYPQVKLAYLTEDEGRSAAEQIQTLGFVPQVYSCNYELLDAATVRSLQTMEIEVIPWTVNEIKDAERLKDWGVNGIITDYPARMISALGKF